MYVMKAYDDALQLILERGVPRTNKRTGIKTLAIFGIQSRYQIDEYFPVLTRRKVWPRSIFAELIWFLSGSTNNKDLQALGANIWTPWVDAEFEKKHNYVEGSFGPVYGFQLRHFGGYYGRGADELIPRYQMYPKEFGGAEQKVAGYDKGRAYGEGGFDQLAYVIKRIKEDPSCRRIMFSLWNPNDMAKQKLPPCHYSFQIFIDDEGRMSGMLTQRSCDFPIGVPANIQFYSALTCMLAQQTGYKPCELIHSTADSHIYWDQIDAVKQYLATPMIDSPKLELNKAKDIYSYQVDDFKLVGFTSGPKIEIPVAV